MQQHVVWFVPMCHLHDRYFPCVLMADSEKFEPVDHRRSSFKNHILGKFPTNHEALTYAIEEARRRKCALYSVRPSVASHECSFVMTFSVGDKHGSQGIKKLA